MSKKNLVYILVFILGVFIAQRIFSGIKHKPLSPPAKKETVKKSPAAKTEAASFLLRNKNKKRARRNRRKKQSSSGASSSSGQEITLPELHLTGIAQSGKQAWAIINNRIVHKGDKIKGAKVIAIYSNQVELNYQGKKFTIRIK